MKKILHNRRLYMLIAILFLTANLLAQEHSGDTHESHSDAHGAHFHANHAAVFLGITSQPRRDNTNFSAGLDYVRSFPPHGEWSVGILSELIFAEHIEWVFCTLLYYNVHENLWLRTGPGIEGYKEDIDESHAHESGKSESKFKFLYRIGAGYDFDNAHLTISPSLDIDLVRSAPALVFGINIGRGF